MPHLYRRVQGRPVRAARSVAPVRGADIWPDDAGQAVLYYDALALLGDETSYSADPANQPPPPNLQAAAGG